MIPAASSDAGSVAGTRRDAGGSYRLVLLRHGESAWNSRNLFTGWVNVGLTAGGERQAVAAGGLLAREGLLPDVVHTSLQRRAIRSAELALAACERDWIPVRRSWRLNSNHYGALQGRDKSEVLAEYGQRQFTAWRRGWDARPPELAPDARYSQFADPRYAALPPPARPRAESLRDVTERLLPYWYDAIVPDLRTSFCVLVVSHGNTVRALVKHLEAITDEAIISLDVPNGSPLHYQLDTALRPLTRHFPHLPSHRSGPPDTGP